METVVHGASELTLKDRLSRLTYSGACGLLGPAGSKLIQLGGSLEVDLDQDVSLSPEAFVLKFPHAEAAITSDPAARGKLKWSCTACRGVCEHVGAAFSLVLEEKTALGLAAPPPQRAPFRASARPSWCARRWRIARNAPAPSACKCDPPIPSGFGRITW